MENTELYQILGQVSYSYSRIDFLISHYAHDFGLADSPYIFFANTRSEEKINKLKKYIKSKVKDTDLISDLDNWVEKLHELRKTRNNLIHSVILENQNDEKDLMFYNYRMENMQLVRDFNNYSQDDLKKLNQSYVDTHNVGYILLSKLKEKYSLALYS